MLSDKVAALQAEKDRLRSECDVFIAQAGACAQEVDRVRVEIGTVQAENERLKARLKEEEAKADRFARHMRENGDLVAEIGGELAMAGCRILALTTERDQARTALAESERKRKETETAAIELAQVAYGVDATAPSEAQMERLHRRASLIFASTPTQETARVQD